MNEEKLIKAMGCIDESLLEEAGKQRQKKRPPLTRIGLVAACLAIFVATITAIYPFLSSESTSSTAAPDGLTNNYSSAEDKPEYETGEKTDDNEAPSSVSDGDDYAIKSESISDSVIAVVPIQVTVIRFTKDGFICTVYDNGGNEAFSNGEPLTVIFANDSETPEGLSENDTVYVTFSIAKEKENTIYAHIIEYSAGDRTPALYGGRS